MEFAHRSVLLHECIDALAIKPDGIYLDGTLGGAGHSLEICRSLTTGRLIGVDRDLVALEAAKKRLYRHAKKVTLVHDNFENVGAILTALGLDRIDGMLFDLGVSSPQLDDAERGFSYMADAPLDMRMDRDQSLTAYEIVNNWPREELKSILYEYGEERCAPQIAAAGCFFIPVRERFLRRPFLRLRLFLVRRVRAGRRGIVRQWASPMRSCAKSDKSAR